MWVEAHFRGDKAFFCRRGDSNSILVEEHLAWFPKKKKGLCHHSMCLSPPPIELFHQSQSHLRKC